MQPAKDLVQEIYNMSVAKEPERYQDIACNINGKDIILMSNNEQSFDNIKEKLYTDVLEIYRETGKITKVGSEEQRIRAEAKEGEILGKIYPGCEMNSSELNSKYKYAMSLSYENQLDEIDESVDEHPKTINFIAGSDLDYMTSFIPTMIQHYVDSQGTLLVNDRVPSEVTAYHDCTLTLADRRNNYLQFNLSDIMKNKDGSNINLSKLQSLDCDAVSNAFVERIENSGVGKGEATPEM